MELSGHDQSRQSIASVSEQESLMTLNDFLAEEPLEITDKNIGEFLISVITGGLYIEPHLILREYIQNSHDAIASWNEAVDVGRIDIKLEPPNIHIIDNGPGMSRDELVASMSKVGISSKPFGATAGFMGIGKLAGLSMAERVQIDSSKFGIPNKNRVAFDAGTMLRAIDERRQKGESKPIVETLKEHSRLNPMPPMPEYADAHYTSVHLLGVSEDYWKVINDKKDFLKKLGLVAPVKQDSNFTHASLIEEILERIAPEHYYPLDIYIDGLPLYRPWAEQLQKPRVIEVVDDEGNQLAYGWACQHEKSEHIPDPLLRGIALLQRGIAIGERNLAEQLGLYGLSSSSSYIYFRWYMGELYITNPRILLTANRMSLRRNEHAIDFVKRVEIEFKKLSSAAAKFSQVDNAARKGPQNIQMIRDVAQQVADRNLTQEMVPSTVKKLVSAREDLKRRYRFLPDEIKPEALQAVQAGDELLKQFAPPSIDQSVSLPTGFSKPVLGQPIADDLELQTASDITVSEEEAKKTISLSEKLGFSPREKRIFQLIINAVAEVSGGKETERFANYLRKIEEVLNKNFQNSDSRGLS